MAGPSPAPAPGWEPSATITDFLLVLVARFAREQLGAAAEAAGKLDVVHAADVIVTMGCGDSCPIFPGKRYLDWNVPDPNGQPIKRVRDIRDDLHARVSALLRDLNT